MGKLRLRDTKVLAQATQQLEQWSSDADSGIAATGHPAGGGRLCTWHAEAKGALEEDIPIGLVV